LTRFPKRVAEDRIGESCLQSFGASRQLRVVLNNVWTKLWPSLSLVQTEADVVEAFRAAYPGDYEFMPHLAPLILRVLRERTFPSAGHHKSTSWLILWQGWDG